MSPHAAALLLADGRLPAGGYAHSGGLEPAVAEGFVLGLDDLESFLAGRLETVGLVLATFAAAACRAADPADPKRLAELDWGLDARMPSPANRRTSRQLGRQLLRVVTTLRPEAGLERLGREPHQPLALGTAAAAFGLAAPDAALTVLHETVAGVTAAAVRLLSVDPLATHSVLAGFAGRLDELAEVAVAGCAADVAELPAFAAPLLDLFAERHVTRSSRLFAS